jgi:hypothetical protein
MEGRGREKVKEGGGRDDDGRDGDVKSVVWFHCWASCVCFSVSSREQPDFRCGQSRREAGGGIYVGAYGHVRNAYR